MLGNARGEALAVCYKFIAGSILCVVVVGGSMGYRKSFGRRLSLVYWYFYCLEEVRI